LWQKCKNLRSHGMTVASFDRIKGRAVSYDVLEPGLNYRIDEIRSALGLVQLSKLAASNTRRGECSSLYRERLNRITGISMPFAGYSRGVPSFHILPTLLAPNIDRATLIEALKQEGIQTSIHYPSIQSFTAYRDIVNGTPLSQEVSARELTLPLYPSMSDSDVDFVCACLEKMV
jgi:dTDP-4-amino-4,6-dideoxygalactose transaminase